MTKDQQIFYEDLREGALDLATTWDKVAYRCGDATSPSSPCALEAKALPATIDDGPAMTRAIAHDAAMYVTAATQQLRALAHLLGPEVVLTGWPVTRAVAEHCGRAAWLLGADVKPTNRVARFYMERIVSVHMARLSAEKIGKQKHAKELKKEREALLGRARTVFDDIGLFQIEELNDWSVGGEPYAGLGKAVNGFGQDALGASGLYDILSTFTHPSLYRLWQQSRTTELEDRTHHGFTAKAEVVQWQFAVASSSVYRAAHHVVGYLGLDDAPLERWADRHPGMIGGGLTGS